MTTQQADTAARRNGQQPLFGRTEKIVAWAVGIAILVGFLLLVLWRFVFVTVPPGHVGVYFSLLDGGTVLDDTIGEGLTAKLPWDRIFLFEVRTQRLPYEVVALSAEGMRVTVEGAALFRPVSENTPDVLTRLGLDYPTRIVEPLVRSIIRDEITHINSNELYSVDHPELQENILRRMRQHGLSADIAIDDLVITEIRLPVQVATAIDVKLAQEQRAAGYEFLIAAEQREAERLRVQAIGLRNFYAIVSEALNDTLLTWRGIEATVQLSQSPNSKVVVVGGNRDQLPLILGSDIANVPSTPQPVPPVTAEQFQLPNFQSLPPIFPNDGRNIMNQPATRQPFPAAPSGTQLDPSDSPGQTQGDAGQKPRSETGQDLQPGVSGSSHSRRESSWQRTLRRLGIAGDQGGNPEASQQILSTGTTAMSGSDPGADMGTELSPGAAMDLNRPSNAPPVVTRP
ncbi:MAG: hypothetical protein JJ899_05315 [Alphaproteobacteria bacterium]|nr:hypothetical protein [Alphaproteobacteria bacterium]